MATKVQKVRAETLANLASAQGLKQMATGLAQTATRVRSATTAWGTEFSEADLGVLRKALQILEDEAQVRRLAVSMAAKREAEQSARSAEIARLLVARYAELKLTEDRVAFIVHSGSSSTLVYVKNLGDLKYWFEDACRYWFEDACRDFAAEVSYRMDGATAIAVDSAWMKFQEAKPKLQETFLVRHVIQRLQAEAEETSASCK